MAKVSKLPNFHAVWQRLALEGKCDDWGGGECKRVLQEWIEAGHPDPEEFIPKSANWVPSAADVKKAEKKAEKKKSDSVS